MININNYSNQLVINHQSSFDMYAIYVARCDHVTACKILWWFKIFNIAFFSKLI